MVDHPIVKKYFQWIRLYTERFSWTVIPVRDKSPLVKWGDFRYARPTAEQYSDWWLHQFPCAGIAVLTGQPSGNLVILDLDPRNGDEGKRYVESLLPQHTVMSNTPSGGAHFFCQADRPVRTMHNLLPGLDVKGDNGYALVPPSVNKKGQYAWASGRFVLPTLPALPEEIYAKIAEKENHVVTAANQESETASIFELGVSEGQRNIALSKLAGRYFAKGLTRAEVSCLLAGANRCFRPPLSRAEVYTVLNSVEQKHTKRLAWANSIEG